MDPKETNIAVLLLRKYKNIKELEATDLYILTAQSVKKCATAIYRTEVQSKVKQLSVQDRPGAHSC